MDDAVATEEHLLAHLEGEALVVTTASKREQTLAIGRQTEIDLILLLDRHTASHVIGETLQLALGSLLTFRQSWGANEEHSQQNKQ